MKSVPKWRPFGGNEIDPVDLETAEIIVLPVCYEHAPSYGSGSGNGPLYVLEASEQLEEIDEETLKKWHTRGIHTLPPIFPSELPETAVFQIEEAAENIFEKEKHLLAIGGDHAISIGLIQSAKRRFPDIGVLQIDAHLDLRDVWNGSRYNHACVMRRVADDMRIPFVQVGIRSFSFEEAELLRQRNYKPFFAHDISIMDNTWMEKVVERLPDKVYLTIDMDGLDPSAAPGTGTPEPGGLSYRQVVSLIKKTGGKKSIIGADINEIMKIPGSMVTEFTAAKIATKIFLSM